MSTKPSYDELKRRIVELEQQLAKSAERTIELTKARDVNRNLLESSPVCTKIVDLDFNLQYMSSSGIRDLKIDDITEYYGNPYPLHFYPDSFKIPMSANLNKVKETCKTITQEASVVDVDGNVLWYQSTLVPVTDDSGQLDYIMVVSMETTERRLAEQRLQDSAEQYKSIIQSSIDGYWLVDVEGNLLEVNDNYVEMSGYSRDELLAMKISDVEALETAEETAKHIKTLAKSGSGRFKSKHRRKNGSTFNVEISCQFHEMFGGRFVVFVRDITRQTENDLIIAKQKELLEKSQELGKLGTWELDLVNNKLYWTDENCRIFGVEPGTVANYEIFLEKVHPDDRDYVNEEWMASVAGKPYDIEHRLLIDSEVTWVREKADLYFNDEGEVISAIGLTQDITHVKNSIQAIESSEIRFRSLFENAPIAYQSLDADGNFLAVNNTFCTMLGYSQEEILGQNFTKILHPDSAETFEKNFPRFKSQGYVNNVEFKFKTKTGRDIDIVLDGKIGVLPDGSFKQTHCVMQNVTERKQAEQDKLNFEKQILQTQKLESLGVLAGGIAHDFNNILMGILGNADLALADMDQTDPAREFVRGINDSTRKAADLVKQMLAYSGKGKFTIEPIDLNKLIDDTVQMLNVSISKNARLRYDYSPEPVFLEGDPSQIRQIIMNLVINASEAVGTKSCVITLATGSMYCDREYIESTGFESQIGHTEKIDEGKYTFIEVSDTGTGMSKDTLAKIFDPFFTTKFTGRGLGLSAVLGIVRGHHGIVTIYSEEGKGTTFKVLFPLYESIETNSNDESPENVDLDWRGEGTFLIADDEQSVRNVGKHMIKKLGFDVLTARNGQEAIEVFKENQADIVGVLLDLTMPEKNGAEVFSEIKKLNPRIKVILSSGYNEPDATMQFVGMGLAGFIQKPYVSKELVTKIIEVMSKE